MDTQNSYKNEENKASRRKKQKRPPKKISQKYLYNAGLAYLQRFTASTNHFQRVMQRKIDRSCLYHKDQDPEACRKDLETVTTQFRELGFLNDEAYAKGMVTSLRLKGLSAKAIHFKLLQKGLSADNIAAALRDIDGESAENEADYIAGLRLARRRKIGPFGTGKKSEEKELGALARAGFSYHLSRKILETDPDDAAHAINAMIL